MTLTTIIILYLLGAAITFIVAKSFRYVTKSNEWEDVYISLLAAILSWIGLLILIIVVCFIYIAEELADKHKSTSKPPKWL